MSSPDYSNESRTQRPTGLNANLFHRPTDLRRGFKFDQLETYLNELGQQLTYEQERLAYESFAAFFSHYLPKKLIRHYVWGKGQRMELTLQEMIDCNPLINLPRSQSFRDVLTTAQSQRGKPVAFEINVLAGALTNGTLGQFTVKVSGKVVADSIRGWQATGTMSFYDEWDFDPKDFATGGRSVQGELKTRFANSFLPGKGYKITSVRTGFSQNQSDTSVVWVGGKPNAEPDRIAELDIELSKADK